MASGFVNVFSTVAAAELAPDAAAAVGAVAARAAALAGVDRRPEGRAGRWHRPARLLQALVVDERPERQEGEHGQRPTSASSCGVLRGRDVRRIGLGGAWRCGAAGAAAAGRGRRDGRLRRRRPTRPPRPLGASRGRRGVAGARRRHRDPWPRGVLSSASADARGSRSRTSSGSPIRSGAPGGPLAACRRDSRAAIAPAAKRTPAERPMLRRPHDCRRGPAPVLRPISARARDVTSSRNGPPWMCHCQRRVLNRPQHRRPHVGAGRAATIVNVSRGRCHRVVAFVGSRSSPSPMSLGVVFPTPSGARWAPRSRWGEAMVAATYVFFLMFWVYGVVPHQWLTWVQNELKWRTDAISSGHGATVEPLKFLAESPIIMSYADHRRHHRRRYLRRRVLGLKSSCSGIVAEPGQAAKAVRPVETSDYGRPLVEGLIAMARTDANPPMPEFRDDYVLQEVDADWLVEGGQAEAVHPHRPVRVHHVRGLRRHLPVEVHPHGHARRHRRGRTAPSARASTRATTSCS